MRQAMANDPDSDHSDHKTNGRHSIFGERMSTLRDLAFEDK